MTSSLALAPAPLSLSSLALRVAGFLLSTVATTALMVVTA
jgi:hypothetical protein